MPPKSYGVREARAKLPDLLSEVSESGQPVTVTRHGKTVATIIPGEPATEKAQAALPKIIALASLKGGVGKTTVAMHLAATIAQDGQRVIVLDADDETSAVRWLQHAHAAQLTLPFQVIEARRNQLMRQARELANAGYIVIIDTPPNNREILKTAATVSDMVLVPVLPTLLDVDRLATTLELLDDLGAGLPQLNYAILLNRFDGRKKLSYDAATALKNHPKLDNHVKSLSAYEKVFGHAPTELSEFGPIWQEIKDAFGGEA